MGYSSSQGIYARAHGGAITSSGFLTATDCMFQGNSATGGRFSDGSGQEGGGGAVSMMLATADLARCTFVSNNAQGGNATAVNQPGGSATAAALEILTRSTLKLTNCTLSGNTVTGGSSSSGVPGDAHGGGLYSQSADQPISITILNCTIAGNKAVGGVGVSTPGVGRGGGIENGDNSTSTLINTIVANNTASTSGANGYGILTDGGSNLCSDTTCASRMPQAATMPIRACRPCQQRRHHVNHGAAGRQPGY